MQESRVTGELVMQWLPVVGEDGRVRMEARWQQLPTTEPAVPHAPAHAA